MHRPSPRPVALILAALATACSAQPTGKLAQNPQGRVITAEQITRSGAENAWEALRLNGAHLSMSENPRGDPTRMGKRGAGSVVLSSTPSVVVDGVTFIDFRMLRNVAAATIVEIRILNGAEGSARFGTGSANGVIVVTTSIGGS